MKVTVVIFKAFDTISDKSFIHGESDIQIHNTLATICPTYEPLHILTTDDAEPISLNTLLIFKI
jgi:hypothetical protein